MSAKNQYILMYNQGSFELEHVLEFKDDMDAATRRYAELEALYCNSAEMDIVLVGSDSLETVRITHRNYFTGEAHKNVDKLFQSLGLS